MFSDNREMNSIARAYIKMKNKLSENSCEKNEYGDKEDHDDLQNEIKNPLINDKKKVVEEENEEAYLKKGRKLASESIKPEMEYEDIIKLMTDNGIPEKIASSIAMDNGRTVEGKREV